MSIDKLSNEFRTLATERGLPRFRGVTAKEHLVSR
ncbi:MAG: hypothetical protein JWR26_3026 [Pedosphaera sp.]|nr:hypothetical protein [Pedosphaera sp.]